MEIPNCCIELLGTDEAIIACSELSKWERAELAGAVEVECFFQDLFSNGGRSAVVVAQRDFIPLLDFLDGINGLFLKERIPTVYSVGTTAVIDPRNRCEDTANIGGSE